MKLFVERKWKEKGYTIGRHYCDHCACAPLEEAAGQRGHNNSWFGLFFLDRQVREYAELFFFE